MRPIHFGTQYLFKPNSNSNPFKNNPHRAAWDASNLMKDPKFKHLGGQAVAIDPESGTIYLQTEADTISRDGLVLNYMARKLDKLDDRGSHTDATQSVNQFLVKYNQGLIERGDRTLTYSPDSFDGRR